MSIIDNDSQPPTKSVPEITNNLALNSNNNISNKEELVDITQNDSNDTRRVINANESELIESSRFEDKDQTVNQFSSSTNEHPDKITYVSHINMDTTYNKRGMEETQDDVNTTTTTEGTIRTEKQKKKKRNNFYNPPPYRRNSSFLYQIKRFILLYVIIIIIIITIILLIIKLS